MSHVVMSKTVVQADLPTWVPRDEFFKTRFWLRLLVILTVVLWLVLVGWIFLYAPITAAPVATLAVGANLTIVLAPVITAAAAVERTLETIFNLVEGSWRTLVAYLGRGLRWLKSAETEVKQARQFLAYISDKYNAEMQSINIGNVSATALTADMRAKMDAANAMLALAQQRLAAAENNLADVTASDGYVNAKAAASIVIGLMLGLIIAAVAQLQMFAILGIGGVPPRVDAFITGLVIGSGSYPLHSLVGILQQGKDTLDSVKGYFGRSAPAAQATQQRITTVQSPAVAGEPGRVQQAVVETTTVQSTDAASPH